MATWLMMAGLGLVCCTSFDEAIGIVAHCGWGAMFGKISSLHLGCCLFPGD